MIGLTNFTQMEVEVNVYNNETKTVQTQVYKPDPEFPWSCNDANAANKNKYEKMTLINYENVHFNLIIKSYHPLIMKSNKLPDFVPVKSVINNVEKGEELGQILASSSDSPKEEEKSSELNKPNKNIFKTFSQQIQQLVVPIVNVLSLTIRKYIFI